MSTPSGTVAIVAALPRELANLARQLAATRISQSNGVLVQAATLPGSSGRVLLVTAGMGPQRAAIAVAAALAHGPIATLLSVGLAGACDPHLAPGSVLEASLVIDVQSGERFSTDARPHTPPCRLVTAPRIAGIAEKQRLYASYSAAAVDMEAATVARLARAHEIPFAAIKAISDDNTADLTALSNFTDSRGHFRTAAFALHTALRPHLWRSTAALGRNSTLALDHLSTAVLQFLTHATRP